MSTENLAHRSTVGRLPPPWHRAISEKIRQETIPARLSLRLYSKRKHRLFLARFITENRESRLCPRCTVAIAGRRPDTIRKQSVDQSNASATDTPTEKRAQDTQRARKHRRRPFPSGVKRHEIRDTLRVNQITHELLQYVMLRERAARIVSGARRRIATFRPNLARIQVIRLKCGAPGAPDIGECSCMRASA